MLKSKSRGFTLIELMITIAIIGILAAIAYPNYQEQVQKSRRADAKIALGEAAQLQERWFTQNGTYTGDITKLGGDVSDDGHYDIAVTLPGGAPCNSAYCYDLTAQPKGSQANDTACGTFELDHTGAQTVTGPSGAANCW